MPKIRFRRRGSVAAGLFSTSASLLLVNSTQARSLNGDLPLDDGFGSDLFSFQGGSAPSRGFRATQWSNKDLYLTQVEYLGLAILVAYAVVYIVGQRWNYRIAQDFIAGVHHLVCCRFLDAGAALETLPANSRQLLARESCSTFLYYATGNRRCSGVLVRIELVSRHDLFLLVWRLFSPAKHRATDRVTIEVAFAEDDLEPLVFAVVPKRDVKKLLHDVPHLKDYATVTKAPSLLPLGLACLSEFSVFVDPLLKPPVVKVLHDHPGLLELLHVTDQNDEPILGQEEMPRKTLRIAFRLPKGSGEGPIRMMALALNYIELLHKFKMSSSTKRKALDKREYMLQRKSVMTHYQRQERVQQLKNEKLQREREEYESLTPEQKRRRDLRDRKKTRKDMARMKRKMKVVRI